MFDRIKQMFKKEEKKVLTLEEINNAIEKIKSESKPKNIDLKVKLNCQNDNDSFNHLKPSSQCGYTAVAMLLSQTIREAEKDSFIKQLIEFSEKEFLNTGRNRKGSILKNYLAIGNYYLTKNNIDLQLKFIEQGYSFLNVISVLKNQSALVVATMLSSSGHFILIDGFDFEKNCYRVKDPFGRFDFVKKKYVSFDGFDGLYSRTALDDYMNKSCIAVNKNFSGIRCLHYNFKEVK